MSLIGVLCLDLFLRQSKLLISHSGKSLLLSSTRKSLHVAFHRRCCSRCNIKSHCDITLMASWYHQSLSNHKEKIAFNYSSLVKRGSVLVHNQLVIFLATILTFGSYIKYSIYVGKVITPSWIAFCCILCGAFGLYKTAYDKAASRWSATWVTFFFVKRKSFPMTYRKS